MQVEGECNIGESQQDEGNSTLLQLQNIMVASIRRKGTRKEVAGIWDPGSTLSFITFALAKELCLNGEPVDLEICTVGGIETKIKSQKYNLVLFDRDGIEVQIEVMGIEQISTSIESVNLEGVLNLFKNNGTAEINRPDSGSVNLLIGFSYADIIQ